MDWLLKLKELADDWHQHNWWDYPEYDSLHARTTELEKELSRLFGVQVYLAWNVEAGKLKLSMFL